MSLQIQCCCQVGHSHWADHPSSKISQNSFIIRKEQGMNIAGQYLLKRPRDQQRPPLSQPHEYLQCFTRDLWCISSIRAGGFRGVSTYSLRTPEVPSTLYNISDVSPLSNRVKLILPRIFLLNANIF